MDLRKIKKLIELVEESTVEELEITSGDESIKIRCRSKSDNKQENETFRATSHNTIMTNTICAPISGQFYRSPSINEKPFTDVGQKVSAGDVLALIESMNRMHQVQAHHAGRISAVLVNHNVTVNSGQPLFVID